MNDRIQQYMDESARNDGEKVTFADLKALFPPDGESTSTSTPAAKKPAAKKSTR